MMNAIKRYTALAVGVTMIILVGFCIIAGVSNAATYTGSATSYASCDGSTTMTASGRTVRQGWAANNFLPLGSWIEMKRPSRVQGIKYWKIMDRGGPGFALDFWSDDCAWMHNFGRRIVTFKAVPKSHLYRGKPYKGWKVKRSSRGPKLVWSAAG